MANGNNDPNLDPRRFAESKKQINELRDQYNKFARAEAENNASALDYVRSLNTELRDSLGIRQKVGDQQKTLRNLGNEVLKSVQQNVTELGNANKINREIAKAQSLQNRLITEISSITKGLTTENLEQATILAETYNIQANLTKELEAAKEAQEEQQKVVKDLQDKSLAIGVLTADELKRTRDKLDVQRDILNELKDTVATKSADIAATESLISNTHTQLGLKGKINAQDAQQLAATLALSKAQEDQIAKLQEEEKIQRKIEDRMGVTGALVEGTGALMERLGMRSGIFQQAMKDASSEMKDMAEQSERVDPATGKIMKNFSKMDIMLKGLGTLASGFGKALFDPLSMGLKLISVLSEINKQSIEFSRLTGQAAYKMSGVATETSTAVDLMKVAAEYTKQTGINAAAIFTPQQLGQIADAKDLLGLSAEQAGSLGTMMKLTGQTADEFQGSVFDGVQALNESADAAIAPTVALQDVLGASDDIKASLGGNPEALGKAAAAARKLGMDLSKVNAIADGLLDFESSIEAELEAQLLTGKNINLNKARELALNNDLEGVAEELSKNGASAAEFAKMNRIQQQAMAKAMGMSREELAKMVLTEKAMADMTDEQKAAARGVTLEQSKQMDIQERIKKAAFKLAEAFAPILEAVVPIVELLGKVAGLISPLTPYLLGAYGAIRLMNGGLTNIASGFGTIVKNSMNFVKNLDPKNFKFSEIGKAFKSGFGDKSKAVFDESAKRFRDLSSGKFISADKAKELGAKMPDSLKKSGDTVGDLSKNTKDVKADSGAGIRGFLKGLGDGLASIGRQLKDVVKGAIAIGVAGLALGGSFALALKMVENVDPVQMIAFAGAISMFGLTLALLGKIGNDVIKGALALGILGVGLIPAAYAFSLLAGVDAGSMFAFAGALSLLGLAAAGLGFLFPYIAMGAGALALLGLALIPAAYGFSLIQGLDMDTILGFAKGVGVLAATTAALGLVAPLIMYGSLALAALGLALIPLSYGFAALGDTPIESIINKIQGLATLAPQLLLVGAGLMGIAAGLGMIAISGIAAIPALAALSAFALVASPLAALGGLFGDGGGEEDNSMAEISSKLDTLISVVSAGGNVYLDGDKVGEAQVLGTYKLS